MAFAAIEDDESSSEEEEDSEQEKETGERDEIVENVGYEEGKKEEKEEKDEEWVQISPEQSSKVIHPAELEEEYTEVVKFVEEMKE